MSGMTSTMAESGPLNDAPIWITTPVTIAGVIINLSGTTAATTTSATSVDVVNYTGAGVLEFCAESTQVNTTHTPSMVVTIDGVAMSTVSPVGTGTQSTIGVLVGAVTGAGGGAALTGIALGAIPFKRSLQIAHTSDGSNSATCRYKYRRTT